MCEGVVAHVHGPDGLTGQFYFPIIHLIVDRRDEDSLFEFKGAVDVKTNPINNAMSVQVGVFDSIAEEYGSPPLLHAYLCTVGGGG